MRGSGWACSAEGVIVNGLPESKIDGWAYFKHDEPLYAGDVLRMKVVAGTVVVGYAGEKLDLLTEQEMYKSTANLSMGKGTTFISSGISKDGEQHVHDGHLQDHIPETLPYDLALRITKDGNVPQIQFNEDGQWHDFALEGGTGLKAGPWFPYLQMWGGDHGDRLSDLRVDRPRATKSAGMKRKPAANPAPVPSGDGAAAASDGQEECALSPQKKSTGL